MRQRDRHMLACDTGAVLVIALVLMLAVLMLAVAAARAAIHAEKSARFERDRQVALNTAEAALSDAQRDIEGANGPVRAALFGAGGAGFVKGCGRGADDLGLCQVEAAGAAPVWQAVDLADEGAVRYGTFTGAQMATGTGTLPVRAPRYIIEFIPATGGPANGSSLYRITAIGFGMRENTRVVLQSFYRKPSAAPSAGGGTNAGADGQPGPPPPAALPSGRIAWREIANWAELHQAAIK